MNDETRNDIREIWITLGKIMAYTEIIEKITKVLQEEKENYYNEACIESQYGTVSKYNPIRSMEYPPLECFENKYDIHSTQACNPYDNAQYDRE